MLPDDPSDQIKNPGVFLWIDFLAVSDRTLQIDPLITLRVLCHDMNTPPEGTRYDFVSLEALQMHTLTKKLRGTFHIKVDLPLRGCECDLFVET